MKRSLLGVLLCLCIFMCQIPVRTMAAAHSGDVLPWEWTDGTYGLTIQLFADEYEPYVSDAAFDWNYISDNVYIQYIYYTPPNHTNLDCDIQIVSDALTGSTAGTTNIYRYLSGSWNVVSLQYYAENVGKAIITLDSETGSTDLLSLGETQIEKTIAHEVGHALALSHPTCTERSVMHQSINNAYVSMTITSHDEENLILKWD